MDKRESRKKPQDSLMKHVSLQQSFEIAQNENGQKRIQKKNSNSPMKNENYLYNFESHNPFIKKMKIIANKERVWNKPTLVDESPMHIWF